MKAPPGGSVWTIEQTLTEYWVTLYRDGPPVFTIKVWATCPEAAEVFLKPHTLGPMAARSRIGVAECEPEPEAGAMNGAEG
ncbi:hypothetical protein LCGC14_0878620 [marine sediment metagenome]|uniref:Uncharacterized protein n=1 Tax=marine sediment metagenome TaxID=412755 RepID=A0A0F9RM29_9ZZZZ|nr:hypothetical protein [Phycisphaerae bacterium]